MGFSVIKSLTPDHIHKIIQVTVKTTNRSKPLVTKQSVIIPGWVTLKLPIKLDLVGFGKT